LSCNKEFTTDKNYVYIESIKYIHILFIFVITKIRISQMSRKQLVVKAKTSDEFKALIRSDENYMMGIKLLCLSQVASGRTSREIEQTLNISFKTVCNWVKSWNEEGLDGLRTKPKSGRKKRLTQENLEEIKRDVTEQTPHTYGYNTGTWTGPILIKHIFEKYGVLYRKAQIYNILNFLGLSYQKGRGVYPESDPVKREEHIVSVKKNDGTERE